MLTKPFSGGAQSRLSRFLQSDLWWSLRHDYMAMGAGIIGWMLALVCGSYLLAWMTVGAQWSIVPVLLWHAGFDLLTSADQSAGVIASTISAIVMVQGVLCAWLLWRRRRRLG